MSLLYTSIDNLKGIGEKRSEILKSLGIYRIMDLLEFYPKTYHDKSVITDIADLSFGEVYTVRAKPCEDAQVQNINGKFSTKLAVRDSTGKLQLIWYNQPYIRHNIKGTELYRFTGKVTYRGGKCTMEMPEYEIFRNVSHNIDPIYPIGKKLPLKLLRSLIKQVLDLMSHEIREILPWNVTEKHKLCSRQFALNNIHFPKDKESFFIAKRRLVFEELFVMQTALSEERQCKPTKIKFSDKDFSSLSGLLPYSLTQAQAKVLKEVVSDFNSGTAMNRLIQGDVGSGKTAVAMLASFIAVNNGYQAILMAPTEVLARQHYNSFCEYFDKLGIITSYISGSLKKREKLQAQTEAEQGTGQIIIGTHALIEEGVRLKKLGLVITDEQHRFGVRQRANLSEKGENPHVMVMTATPIPRTLALVLYRDMDISVIDQLPPGRQQIETFAVSTSYRPRIYSFIKKQLEVGRQAYVICPMIEDKETDDSDSPGLVSVEKYSEDIRKVFGEYRVEALHGKMKNEEKNQIMQDFAEGNIHILVSTTVIEVGINVPNATVMLIENAERFGLSQLHQLRGRVGRGAEQSYCIMVTDSKSKISKQRLKAMTQTGDGFKLSELDLKIRGPGDFYGTRQHGLPEMRIANFYNDMEILKEVQEAVEACDIPEIQQDYPELYEKMTKYIKKENNLTL